MTTEGTQDNQAGYADATPTGYTQPQQPVVLASQQPQQNQQVAYKQPLVPQQQQVVQLVPQQQYGQQPYPQQQPPVVLASQQPQQTQQVTYKQPLVAPQQQYVQQPFPQQQVQYAQQPYPQPQQVSGAPVGQVPPAQPYYNNYGYAPNGQIDDPSGIWIFLILGIVCSPILCCIGLCVYSGRPLPPRMAEAYRTLKYTTCCCGIAWAIIVIIYLIFYASVAADDSYDPSGY